MIRGIVLFLSLLLATPGGAQTFPALTGRVVDTADLLSPAQEAQLTGRLADLERRTTDQLVIVTLPSLGGRSIEDYGLALGNHWGIGQRGKDNGVLLILAMEDRKVRIAVGYGLEAILTNERAAEIIRRDILPHMRKARYAPGIEAGVSVIVSTLIAHAREPRVRRR